MPGVSVGAWPPPEAEVAVGLGLDVGSGVLPASAVAVAAVAVAGTVGKAVESIVAVGGVVISAVGSTAVAVAKGAAGSCVGVGTGVSVGMPVAIRLGKPGLASCRFIGAPVPLPINGLGCTMRCTCRYQALPNGGPLSQPSGPWYKRQIPWTVMAVPGSKMRSRRSNPSASSCSSSETSAHSLFGPVCRAHLGGSSGKNEPET